MCTVSHSAFQTPRRGLTLFIFVVMMSKKPPRGSGARCRCEDVPSLLLLKSAVLFVERPSRFTLQPPVHYGGRLTGCCLLMVPVNCYGHELEACTYRVPTKVAPASCAHTACQVRVLFLLPSMREVKMAVPFYAAQQGTIIRPLGAIFCQSERVPYGQETLPRGLWLFFGMDLLSPHLSKLLQTSLN